MQMVQSAPMASRAFKSRFTALLASLAILMMSLAPAAAHALAASGKVTVWMELCSATGAKPVKLTLDAPSGEAPARLAADAAHCPFCTGHGGMPDFLPGTGFVMPLADAQRSFPALYYAASHPLFAWATPRSRAPPAFHL